MTALEETIVSNELQRMRLAAILTTALQKARPQPGADAEWPEAHDYYDRLIRLLDPARSAACDDEDLCSVLEEINYFAMCNPPLDHNQISAALAEAGLDIDRLAACCCMMHNETLSAAIPDAWDMVVEAVEEDTPTTAAQAVKLAERFIDRACDGEVD